MAEIVFESLAVALESARGTAITNPTHILPFSGSLTPMTSRAKPEEQRGTLARSHRSQITQRWGEGEGEGPLDTYALPVLLNMIVAPVTSPTTPTNGVLTRLWTFTPSMTADNLKSGTFWWGDPNVKTFRGAFGMLDELTIEADATGEDVATMGISFHTRRVTGVTTPTYPSQLVSPLVSPAAMQLWMDTSSAIGTTAITGRVLGGDMTLPGGITYKWMAEGPGGNLEYVSIGREPRQMELNLRFELPDTTQFDLADAGTVIKIRWRLNGPLIESVTPDYYHYVEIDCYAPIDALSWGDNQGTNRVAELSFLSEYNSTLGADWQIKIQNDRTSL